MPSAAVTRREAGSAGGCHRPLRAAKRLKDEPHAGGRTLVSEALPPAVAAQDVADAPRLALPHRADRAGRIPRRRSRAPTRTSPAGRRGLSAARESRLKRTDEGAAALSRSPSYRASFRTSDLSARLFYHSKKRSRIDAAAHFAANNYLSMPKRFLNLSTRPPVSTSF